MGLDIFVYPGREADERTVYGASLGILVDRVKPELGVGVVYGCIMPGAFPASASLAFHRLASFGSPYRILGSFAENPAAIIAATDDVHPVCFAFDASGKPTIIQHYRVGKPFSPAGSARLPSRPSRKTARLERGTELPLGILSGSSGKVEGVLFQPACQVGRPASLYPVAAKFIEGYFCHI